MSRLDNALERAAELLRMDGVVGVGGAVVAGEDVIVVQLDRPERDLAEPLPADIDGFSVQVLEDRTFVFRGKRLVSVSRDVLDLQSAQLDALSERIASGRPSASDYHRLLRELVEAALADQPIVDWNEIERITRAGVRAFPTDTILLGHLLALAARRGATGEYAAIAQRIAELDPDSKLVSATHMDAATARRADENQARLRELLEAASGEDPRARADAIDELERWTSVFPGDADAQAALGFGYLSTGQTKAMLSQAKNLLR
jgi:hypothetical protein